MIASTSRGAGTTTVPSPHCLLIVGPIGTTLGKPLLWSNFSFQLERTFDDRLLIVSPRNERQESSHSTVTARIEPSRSCNAPFASIHLLAITDGWCPTILP